MALGPGDTLLNGQYRILRLLGRGGFGFVYSAQEQLTGETVAIKELVPALVADPKMVQRFIQEARATQRLTHPNIVRTHNIFRDAGNYYLVMEYMPGGSLADRLQRGRLGVADALRIMAELCTALGYAHQRGVVHCDLKPANVLFDVQGAAHLADFGISHVSDELMTRQVLTSTGMTMGTMRYMAPEQLEGVRDDPRVDVYALGALLYEMLAGQPYLNFEAETTPAAQMRNMQRIQHEPPRPLRLANPEVPAWLAQVVERALRKEPAERYADAGALAAALARRREVAAPAAPHRALAAPRRSLPAWFWPAVGGAVALLLIVVAGTVVLLGSGSGGGQASTPQASPPILAQATAAATSTATPTATPRPLPSETPHPTAAPSQTPAPTATEPPAPTLVPDRLFVVVYPLQDGLSLRAGPATSNSEIAILRAGTQLALRGEPVAGSDGLRWWPVSSAQGEGWVAEWYGGWRLIKPVMAPGDLALVVNPTSSGTVPLRDSNCDALAELSPGTRLTVLDGPTTQCDTAGSSMIEQGRQWWYVGTADGAQGWVADFYSTDLKPMLIAPPWYVSLVAGP
jgi:hypothetical protein